MTLTFIVPMPEPITNASGRSRHWRRAHDDKKRYWAFLDQIAALKSVALADVCLRIPAPPAVPLARVSMHSLMHLGGAMDDDNALARHKPLLDWLKTRGYIADDRKKNIVWESLPEQKVKRDGKYRIELSVTPL